MKRSHKITFGILATLLVALFAAAWTVLASESGLRWLLARIAASVPGQLEFGTVQGELGGPIKIENLSYRYDGIELRVATIDLAWNPWALLADTVAIEQLAVADVNYVSTRSPSLDPIQLPELIAPIDIRIDALRAGPVRVKASPDAAVVTIDAIDAALRWSGAQLDISSLDVRAPQYSARVMGQLEMRGNYTARLDTNWSVVLPDHTVRGQGQVQGTLAQLELNQNLESPLALPVRIMAFDLLTAPRWEAHVDTIALDLRPLLPRWPLVPAAVVLDAQGDAQQTRAQVHWRGTHELTGPFELRASLALVDKQFEITALDAALTDSDTRVNARGSATLNPDAAHGVEALRAELSWSQLRWPLHAKGTQRDTNSATQGSFPLQGGRAGWGLGSSADADTPPSRPSPLQGEGAEKFATVVISPKGQVTFEGVPDAYALNLVASLAGEQVPAGEWTVNARGDTEHIEVTDAAIATLGGTLKVGANVTWSPMVKWSLHANARDLDPARHWSQWPGRIAAQLVAEGAVHNEIVSARVDLKQLDGRVRGYPVRARLRGQLDGDAVTVQLAEFRSGDAVVTARGTRGTVWNADVNITAPHLAALLPELRGAVTGELRVRGSREQPKLQFSVNADGLTWKKYSATRADFDGALDWDTKQPSKLDLVVKQGELAGRPYEAFELHGAGALNQHRITALLTAPTARATLEGTGAWSDNRWRGTLSGLEMKEDDFGAWSLAQPVALTASSTQAQLAHFCLNGGYHGRICARMQWAAGDAASAEVTLDRVPAALLNTGDRSRFDLAGAVSGELRVRYALVEASAAAPLAVVLGLQLSPGEMRVTAGSEGSLQFQHHGAQLNATIDAQGARGKVELDAGDLGRAVISTQLPGWTPEREPAAQPLEGLVQAEVRDLGFLSKLLPTVDGARGQIQVDVSLAGTLATPQVRGHATLTEGAAALPGIGIALRSIRIDAHNSADDRVAFSARAQSGPGFVEIKGDVILDRASGWPVYAEIRGENFMAVNLPESYVLASPELQLHVSGNRIDLNGVLTIPEARYAARDTSDAVTVSSDVVIKVKGETEAAPREGKWQIWSAIRFVLGEKVTFNGFGLKGKVRGEVVAIEEPKKLTTGYGELQIVDATFNAYKIDLAVTRGRLTFAGGPINNPGIDARAVREAGAIRQAADKGEKAVTREQGGILVGALVRGTLRKLEITLFSDPPRDQADVLSLLLFGVPLGEATTEEGKALFIAASTLRLSGRDDTVRKIGRRFGIEEIRLETGSTPEQAALVLGRYFGPRLYVNYIVSASANVVRVRYRISSKWTLQSEQSDIESAADLLYTFER